MVASPEPGDPRDEPARLRLSPRTCSKASPEDTEGAEGQCFLLRRTPGSIVIHRSFHRRSHERGQPRPAGFQGYHQVRDVREDAELTHVGPGTPCGEYLRRYWQPVAMSGELGVLPLVVRILGEDLVLFRDGSGRPGLLHRHCAHRGASLEYGIVAERGIICCYHGWHYDIDGTILRAGVGAPRQPRLPPRGAGRLSVHEHQGLLFAWLGPPEERPPFPIFDTERMPDATASRSPSPPPATGFRSTRTPRTPSTYCTCTPVRAACSSARRPASTR